MRLILASQNKGKAREMEGILGELGIKVVMASDLGFNREIEETGKTFAQNALLKAIQVSQVLAGPVVADDSGLEVEALAGAPGVFSSRFAGEGATDEQNNKKLLQVMEGIPQERRQASFRTVLALSIPGQEGVLFEGRCDGYISFQLRGDKGFGYDPLFVVASYGKTFGELGLEIKNHLSHRGKALKKLKEYLRRDDRWFEKGN